MKHILSISLSCLLSVLVFLTVNLIGHSQEKGNGTEKGKEGDEVFAVINGSRVITRKEVDDLLGSQIHDLQEKIFFIRNTALNNLIIKVLLEEEAKNQGLTVTELKKQILRSNVVISQDKVDQRYLENKSFFANMGEDEAKERIRLDLESYEKMQMYSAYISEMRQKSNVQIFIKLPQPVFAGVSFDGPTRGASNALVTIVEFSDFQCPYCREAAKTLEWILQEYSGRVRLIFKHMPLPIHPMAFISAQASVCADNQKKFWRYHDRLFKASVALSDAELQRIADEVGLDLNLYKDCMGSELSRVKVLKDIEQANKIDVQGTPTFLINGRIFRGVVSKEDIRKVIEAEIAKEGRL